MYEPQLGRTKANQGQLREQREMELLSGSRRGANAGREGCVR